MPIGISGVRLDTVTFINFVLAFRLLFYVNLNLLPIFIIHYISNSHSTPGARLFNQLVQILKTVLIQFYTFFSQLLLYSWWNPVFEFADSSKQFE